MNGKRSQSRIPGGARRALPAALIMVAVGACGAQGQLSIVRHVVAGGGLTTAAGAACTLGSTVGQSDAGALSGGVYLLQGGFWLGGEASSGITSPEVPVIVAGELRLIAGRPNPFFTTTHALLDLPEAQRVKVSVYDHSGRLVQRLCDRLLPAGHHEIPWTGRDAGGVPVANGVYLMRIETQTRREAKNLVLLGH